jgi:hypothetical protein
VRGCTADGLESVEFVSYDGLGVDGGGGARDTKGRIEGQVWRVSCLGDHAKAEREFDC